MDGDRCGIINNPFSSLNSIRPRLPAAPPAVHIHMLHQTPFFLIIELMLCMFQGAFCLPISIYVNSFFNYLLVFYG